MPIDVFSTDDGMLTVQKYSQQMNSDPYTVRLAKFYEPTLVGLDAESLVDTIMSYQTYDFAMQDATEKGKCDICGNVTEYKNRHICKDCWEKHEKEIVNGLKNIVFGRTIDLA